MIKDGLKITACMSLAVLVCAFSGCDSFTSADQRTTRAAALLEKGDYSEAMIELKNALADAPGDARAQLLVARASLQLGNFDGAESALHDAAAAGADPGELAKTRAQLQLRRGEFAPLLKSLDDGSLAVPAEARPGLRAQAQGGLDRCNEAIPLARNVLSSPASQPVMHVVIAECYARRGNVARGLRELDAAVVAAPDDAESWMARGRLQQLSGAKQAALESWRKAAELAPGHVGVPQQVTLYAALADLQIETDDLAGLRVTRERLVRIAPQGTITELLGARMALMQGELDKGVTTLRQLATAVPELAALHLQLASAYLAQGSFEQARRELDWLAQHVPSPKRPLPTKAAIDALMRATPDSGEFWMRSAAAQLALGQTDLARAALVKARARPPTATDAALALAQLELDAGNNERALELTQPLAEKFPADTKVLSVRADALQAAQRYADAAALLERLQANARSVLWPAALYRVRKLGGLGAQTEPLERWLADNPKDVEVRGMYADDLRVAGANRAAIAQYEMLIAQAPRSVVALNNLAWLYYLEGDARAVPIARRAMELAPKAVAVADTLGWLLVESGEIGQGLELLANADRVVGVTQPEVRLHYAAALARSGDMERARAVLEELTAESPEYADPKGAERLLAAISEQGT